ncbi:unnamed protein product [Merluccius merluccius]
MPARALLSLTSVPACRTTRLLPTHRLPDYPPVAEAACRTTRLLPTLPAGLPACCRAIACQTTRLLPSHRLPDY